MVMQLQRLAGNGAVAAAVGGFGQANERTALQRACGCGGGCESCRADSPTTESDENLATSFAPVQRTLRVADPGTNIPNPGGTGLVQTNAATVEGYLATLCPAGGVTVDKGSGEVALATKDFCTKPTVPWWKIWASSKSMAQASATPVGCGCVCDLVASSHPWKISVNDADWPHTDFDDDDAADGKKPGGTGGSVTTPSPNSPKLWGAATASGKETDIPPWLVLGHELCGHGWLANAGRAGPDDATRRGEGGHQDTVAQENALRKEHGIELRGTFKQPDCGESYWRDKASPGTVNWSSFHSVCEAWRADYNKKNGTSFKIGDTIP
jgi:hypothetical protein